QPPPERELELEVVRHDASAIRQRNGRHAGIGGRGLAAAEDRHLVPRAHASQQLADVSPDPAPNPTVLGGRHRDLRCPRSPNFVRMRETTFAITPARTGAPDGAAPGGAGVSSFSRWNFRSSPLFEGSPNFVPRTDGPRSGLPRRADRPACGQSGPEDVAIQVQVGLRASFGGKTLEHKGASAGPDLLTKSVVLREGV